MTLLSAIITLILVIDPFGNIPVFVSVLSHTEAPRRRKIIVREMIIAFGVLVFFLFLGKYILKALQVSQPALSIAGGVILFLITIKMVFPPQKDASYLNEDKGDPLIVPLAVPLIAGPSSMAMVVLLSTTHPEKILTWLAALAAAWFVCSIVLVLAENLARLLGPRVLKAIERLMGMILATMAVQMLLTGISEFLLHLQA